MSRNIYSTGLLLAACIERSYPVALLGWPELTPERWRRFCADRIEARHTGDSIPGDILVAMDEDGYVRGLCVYACVDDGTSGRRIVVSGFAVAHLVDASCLAAGLLTQLQAAAQSSGCRSIGISSAVASEWAPALQRRYDLPVERIAT